ncbi:hypothetical protein AAur_pTC10259 (plasmid) [Paenarthrobacter aurescens TC1]|uniref:GAF domain-containing protein n=1 Tax=Paenarthrobacter aurescens (strain TC1) TaxID=290340 RepID=A1RD16_PAEAT|nr:hypothetical protein AAur_pTC10259 [Paenarthrobacter aurescens TC1]
MFATVNLETAYQAWTDGKTLAEVSIKLGAVGRGWLVLVVLAVVYICLVALGKYIEDRRDRSLLNSSILGNQFAAITNRLASEIELPASERRTERKPLVGKILQALVDGRGGVRDARAVFYTYDDSKPELKVFDYAGQRNPSGPFEAGTARGDAAIEFVTQSPTDAVELIRECKKETREGWKGSGQGYDTYISAVVATTEGPIGMLSLDAPHAGSLTGADKRYVRLAASLLAITFTPRRIVGPDK